MNRYRVRAVVRIGRLNVTYRKTIWADNPSGPMAALYTWVRAMGGRVEDIRSVTIKRRR